MALFAILFRLHHDDEHRRRLLHHAVGRLSPDTLIYDELAGVYVARADLRAHEVHKGLTAAAKLRPARDLLVVIDLSKPEYSHAGSDMPERLDAILAAR